MDELNYNWVGDGPWPKGDQGVPDAIETSDTCSEFLLSLYGDRDSGRTC